MKKVQKYEGKEIKGKSACHSEMRMIEILHLHKRGEERILTNIKRMVIYKFSCEL